MGAAAVDMELFAQNMVRGAKCRFCVAIADAQRIHHIGRQLAPAGWRTRHSRGARIADRRQCFIFDVDARSSVFGDVTAVRDHQRDRLAHKGHFARRQRIGPQLLARFAALRRFSNHAAFREHGFEVA